MLYEELHCRYGDCVSHRLRSELTPTDFDAVGLGELLGWLKSRARTARENYRSLLNNPSAMSSCGAGDACRRWREAEDLVYLVALAEAEVEDAKEAAAQKETPRRLLYGES